MSIPTRYERCGKPQTYKEAVLKFLTLSTVRGMKRVTMAVSYFWSAVWVASIILLVGIILTQLICHFDSYLKYDVIQTSIEQTDYLINYPTVTVCPLQPFNSRYAQPKVDREFLKGDLHILEYLARLEEKRNLGVISEDLLILDAETLASIIGYYQNIKQSNVIKFGHSKESLIIDCKIEQTDARTGMKSYTNCSNVTHMFSAQYFNCYQVVVPQSLKASVSNLMMIIYLDDFGTLHYPQMLSTDFISQGRGVKVVIHEDVTWPDLSSGDEIAPGVAATFYIKEREHYRAQPPWGNCSEKLENGDAIETKRFVDQAGNKYKYSQDLCKKLVCQRNVVEKCKCKLALLPIPDFDSHVTNDAENITFCDDIDVSPEQMKKFMACVQEQLKDFRDWDFDDPLDKICPMPCYDQSYDYIKALSQWPHDSYHIAFYETFIKHQPFAHRFQLYEHIAKDIKINHTRAYDDLLTSDLIERNFLRLSFQMKYKFDVIRQEPKMTSSQLLANIGGTLSLWLGLSVIAIIELLEFFVDVFRIYRLRNSGDNILEIAEEAPKRNDRKVMTDDAGKFRYGNQNGKLSVHDYPGVGDSLPAVRNGFSSVRDGFSGVRDSIPRDRYSAFNEDCWF